MVREWGSWWVLRGELPSHSFRFAIFTQRVLSSRVRDNKRKWEKKVYLLKDWIWITGFLFISEGEHFLSDTEEASLHLIFSCLSF